MRLRRTTAAVVVGIAVLAGCSNGETANETLPPATPSAAPTSEAPPPLGPTDFPVPPEARIESLTGATAFVDYYVTLMDRAQTRLTSEGLRELSSDCKSCIVFADGIDSYSSQGYRVEGGGIQLKGASDPVMINRRAEFSISVQQTMMKVLDPTGNPVGDLSTPDAAYPASGAAVVWSSTTSSWLMAELTIQ